MGVKHKKNSVFITERYNPQIDFGLTEEQVKTRIEEGNINSARKKYSKSFISIVIGNVCTLFNLLGLIIAIGLALVEAPIFDFVFTIVYVINILIGIIQELRAKFCIDKLSLLSTRQSKVMREGALRTIPSKHIVLDDIILLGLGNQIPTDSIILEGTVEVNESLLTGESIAIKKTVGDELLSGSYITSGSCTVRADKVGKSNYVSKLTAKARKYKKPQSELMGSLQQIIRILSCIIIPLAIILFTKSFLLTKTSSLTISSQLQNIVRKNSTVIIGMIPSGLMLLTSLALTIGIIKLSNHNTLVQDLYSLEMLARVDTICFDKTGTLTDGRMVVHEVIELSANKKHDTNKIIGAMIGTLKDNNQTAIALFDYFGPNHEYKAIASLPFNSIRKLSAVSFEKMGTFAIGAPEFVLSESTYTEVKSFVEQYAGLGFRIILLAHSNKNIENEILPNDFLPYAMILLVDNVREEAISTVKWFKENDVAIKVISGDNPITVSEVAKRVGIPNADQYVSLEGLTNNEVYAIATKYTVFGRVSPEQKSILIKSLKNAGHTTAMTGDGVNDILALKEADCAITVAAGSDSVKSISNIVLLDNNFNSMPFVVYEGRRVINNVQSSASLYLMKTIFTILVAVSTLFIPQLKEYPFSLAQMNLLEVFVIGIPSFFLSLQPNSARIQGKFISEVLSKSLPSAVLMAFSAGVIGLFGLFIGTYKTEVYTTLAVYALTYSGMVSLYEICIPFNKYRAVLFSSVLAALLVFTAYAIEKGVSAMGFVVLSPFKTYWGVILLVITIVLVNVIIWSFVQRIFSKVKFKEPVRKNKSR